jgi:hypothetical protein
VTLFDYGIREEDAHMDVVVWLRGLLGATVRNRFTAFSASSAASMAWPILAIELLERGLD